MLWIDPWPCFIHTECFSKIMLESIRDKAVTSNTLYNKTTDRYNKESSLEWILTGVYALIIPMCTQRFCFSFFILENMISILMFSLLHWAHSLFLMYLILKTNDKTSISCLLSRFVSICMRIHIHLFWMPQNLSWPACDNSHCELILIGN